MKLGASPKFKSSPKLAADHVALIEAQNRQAAARQALDDLIGEERQAQIEVDESVAALHAEIRAQFVAEADTTAARILKLEAESLHLRGQLEGIERSGITGWGNQALSDTVRDLLRTNTATRIGVRNAPRMEKRQPSCRAYSSALRLALGTTEFGGRRKRGRITKSPASPPAVTAREIAPPCAV